MPHIATLLHISDLHLSRELMEDGRSLWIMGPRTHAYAKIDALSATVFEIEEVNCKQIDAVVVTGDVTTDGSPESLRTALEFIEQKDIYRLNPPRRVLRGLNANSTRRIVIAGNHDRYGGHYIPLPQQAGNSDLEKILATPREYPFVVGCRRLDNSTESASANHPAVILFVIDSTLVQPNRWDFHHKLARGRIELGECNRIRELATKIRRDGEVTDLAGNTMHVDYDSSVRVALLHHHPVLPSELDETGITAFAKAVRKLNAGLTLMENSNAFVDACFDAEIDFVLFGHQHREYEVVRGRINPRTRLSQRIRFFCCPSASEYSETNNGFNLIEVYTDGIEMKQYRWSGSKTDLGSFALARPLSYRLDRPTVLGTSG